ncbi:DUF192 domain-containing protein [Pontixanthobacter aestiaquae]|nr:DUF192 domain-containing protein [Pontixanthobacter aestiaquae]MDN3646269.1 DUF192 domain-containing protein [Pontixanthobacter aestiaquae]
MLLRTLMIVAALGLAACTPQTATAPAVAEPVAKFHPASGLEVVPLTVTSGDTVHNFQVEIARTGNDQALGLMHRTDLGPNEGMIFPRSPARPASFWMKNTVIPLDIIFVGTDGRILNIGANAVPLSLDPVVSIGPAALVFEIPGGRAAELGIKAGDLVEWEQ